MSTYKVKFSLNSPNGNYEKGVFEFKASHVCVVMNEAIHRLHNMGGAEHVTTLSIEKIVQPTPQNTGDKRR